MKRTQRIFGAAILGALAIAAGAWMGAATVQAEPVRELFDRIGEQRAAFESFQVNRRFFNCVAEAANANLILAAEAATLTDSAACLRSLLTRDATLDNDGLLIDGQDAIIAAVVGVLANVRQNVTFTLEAPLVLSFEAGRLPGTGEISVSFGLDTTQEIVAPGPFGPVLGGQVAQTRNQITLRATRPHQWRMHRLAVRSLNAESGVPLRFRAPFPRDLQNFPSQRGT